MAKANQNDPEAQYAVANAYLEGKIIEKNIQLGMEWDEKAAQNGHAIAQFQLGHMKAREATLVFSDLIPPYANCFGVDMNTIGHAPVFIPLQNNVIEFKKAEDLIKIVEAYEKARVKPAYQDARNQLMVGIDWLENAAAQGLTEAQYELAEIYKIGGPFPYDVKRSVLFMEMASDKGHRVATVTLSEMCGRGIKGVLEVDKAKSLKLLKKASRLGELSAQNLLAIKLIRGEDVEYKDPEGAVQLLEKAAAAGFIKAIHNLAICLYIGEGVEQDQERAITLLQANDERDELVAKTLNQMLSGTEEISIKDLSK
ncbi:MAG: hypothetical protein LBS60_07680 [Deltaproteobacteria bacterium]|nr:hypothetical protein [Deltaproteobacteria bacterium]